MIFRLLASPLCAFVCVGLLSQRVEAQTPIEYRVLATSKTSTMQKELAEAGDQGFGFVGMTVAKTLVGGDEVVSILRRKAR